ncbi:YggS family pyridoxal phosphate-dependent enzyme [Streptomyces spiramenti]|uniref:Pyridoxal phosphate homeostasis protein n=1 Tax=Streptomyces spiramenti TaxID=2720606 RepID=A0ABX1AJM9_9ACTN|nr:YggS family pyridoxal phosphate-dependent enzyme [Streptomyces spiramenti]NJP67328.1 YggS family pyridoxal phosphate-dependent enzyme [Streptomyces spiramenti]
MAEPHEGPAEQERRPAELRSALARVEERVAGACEAAGRDREAVTLIVVTKFWPASDVRLLAGLGVRHVAENRDQEAAAKAAACADLPLSWHFVGQLQTNKARSVVEYADYVHSVDRPRLVKALSAAAEQRGGREVAALVQVALEKEGEGGGGAARGGAAPEEVRGLAEEIMRAPGLRFAGLMTVAPLEGAYAGRPAAAFERVAELSRSLRVGAPAATMVSAGMSADLEEAIAAGATHVRVGSAVLGVRPPLR